MDPRILDLYNEYVHGDMPRRVFFRRVTEIAGSVAAASALLALVEPDYARGQQVPPGDERIETGYVEYEGSTGAVRAYQAMPKPTNDGRLGTVLVIHENRGLNPHLEDVARRVALAGHVALAPDGLSYVGGAPADQEAARDLFGRSDRDVITADVLAAVPYLASHPRGNGGVASVGFCYGGGVALQSTVQHVAVRGAVCFYGRALTEEDVARVKAPLMLHYAADDPRINAGIDDFRRALDAHAVEYSLHMYPGTGHGFHNDTSAARYDARAAGLAWRRTLAFFSEVLAN
jgi:carboxymethylenebutenolidase